MCRCKNTIWTAPLEADTGAYNEVFSFYAIFVIGGSVSVSPDLMKVQLGSELAEMPESIASNDSMSIPAIATGSGLLDGRSMHSTGGSLLGGKFNTKRFFSNLGAAEKHSIRLGDQPTCT
jgi:hypothetical protein